MGKPVEVSEQNFEQEVLQSELPVLVDFWAEWCVPCKRIAPIVEELAQEYDGRLKVAKCDVDANPQLPVRFHIMGIPTLILFKNGQPVETIVGVRPKSYFEQVLKQHLA